MLVEKTLFFLGWQHPPDPPARQGLRPRTPATPGAAPPDLCVPQKYCIETKKRKQIYNGNGNTMAMAMAIQWQWQWQWQWQCNGNCIISAMAIDNGNSR